MTTIPFNWGEMVMYEGERAIFVGHFCGMYRLVSTGEWYAVGEMHNKQIFFGRLDKFKIYTGSNSITPNAKVILRDREEEGDDKRLPPLSSSKY